MLGSQSLGIKKLPVASTSRVPTGILTASLAPTAAMRPFAITTVNYNNR
jgi:hypothetical protein